MRKAFGVARLIVAALCVVSLVSRLVWSLGVSGPIVANFFSYFTMESAIAATILWVIGGVLALRTSVDPLWLTSAKAIVLTYQIVSGIVFGIITLEAVARGFPMLVPWSSDVLHYVLPVYALVDWLAAPGRPRPRWATLRLILIFPLIWVVYTIIRGSLVGWFPYFFLDPTQVSPVEATIYCFFAALIIVIVGATVIVLGRVIRPFPDNSTLPRLGGRVGRR